MCSVNTHNMVTHSHTAIVIKVLRAAGAADDVGVLAVEGGVAVGAAPGCKLIHQFSVLFHQALDLLLKVFKLTTQLALLGLGLFTVTTLCTALFHGHHSATILVKCSIFKDFQGLLKENLKIQGVSRPLKDCTLFILSLCTALFKFQCIH